jgi:hypothetical protein
MAFGLVGEFVKDDNNYPDTPQSKFWENCSEEDKNDHVDFICLVAMGSKED